MSADNDLVLDLSRDEDLAVFLALVPDWPELADGLDLTTEDGQAQYRTRLQASVDERVLTLAREAAALSTLPPPTKED